MDVIGNNVANVNTTGFKSARVDFEEAFSQQMSAGPGGIPMQVGTGVNTSAISNQFLQGAITRTSNVGDVAVSGNGFFVVQDTLSGAQYVSRDGAFHVDDNGYLVTNNGLRVQGYSDAGLSARGDIQIDNTGAPGGSTAKVVTYDIDSDGKINVRLEDGTEFVRGQLLLQTLCRKPKLRARMDSASWFPARSKCPTWIWRMSFRISSSINAPFRPALV